MSDVSPTVWRRYTGSNRNPRQKFVLMSTVPVSLSGLAKFEEWTTLPRSCSPLEIRFIPQFSVAVDEYRKLVLPLVSMCTSITSKIKQG